jgi:MOSC domain-containing protein YiiM
MQVLSVNVAVVGNLFMEQPDQPKRIASAIHKHSVQGAVQVQQRGVAGDEQADLRIHGGPDKAVYAYPSEHYAFWAQQLTVWKRKQLLPPGSMGENLTLQGLLESDVWVGDRLHIGNAMLEVTEPRRPCFKFNAKIGLAHAAKMMIQACNTGFYLRVLQPGALCAGDRIGLVPGPREVSISQINEQRRKGRQQELF